jgi:hypothetical protein
LLRLLGDAAVGAIVVELCERLGRMNTELVEVALGAQPLAGDLTSMCVTSSW